ncbi:MAG: DUF3221 domain-containing protein [Clostridiales bacterium]|nr:DUF3221 domain-containing protein [Clostridiales bacterium]
MKKIRLFVLMLFILSASLVGCKLDTALKDIGIEDNNDPSKDKEAARGDKANKENESNLDDVIEEQVFEGDVIGADGALLISPDKDSAEHLSADKISVAVREAEIIDDKGNTVDMGILKPGDRVKVTYNGLILESYPAQITASKIELIGRNHLIDGFVALIDDIYQEDSALNDNISMIAFDTTDWTMLSKIEVEIILAIAKEKYGFEVVEGTFDELAEQELIDKDNLYFENGILIEIKDIEVNKDKDEIEASIKKWRSGLGAIGWDAKAKFDKDKWKIVRESMWIS